MKDIVEITDKTLEQLEEEIVNEEEKRKRLKDWVLE